MKLLKEQKTRIWLSVAALVAFATFAVTNLLTCSYTFYREMYRMVALSVPFVLLLVFNLLECRMRYFNKRWFLAGIFLVYALQILVFDIFGLGMSQSPIFCADFLESIGDTGLYVHLFRTAVLILLPIVARYVIKLYAVLIMSGMSLTIVAVLYHMSSMDFYMMVCLFGALADLLFCATLFKMADFATGKNGWDYGKELVRSLADDGGYDDFEDFDDFDDFEDDDDHFMGTLDRLKKLIDDGEEIELELEDVSPRDPSDAGAFSMEYTVVTLFAVEQGREEFIALDTMLRRVQCAQCWDKDGRFYTSQDCVEAVRSLKGFAEEVNAATPGLLEQDFFALLDDTLASFEEGDVMVKTMRFAHAVLDVAWLDSAERL